MAGLLLFAIAGQLRAGTGPFEGHELSHDFPDWFVDSPFLDLEEVTEEASNEDKKGLMILYTTQGCSYCGQFIKRSLGNPEIAKLVQKRFASIGLEMFDDAEMVTPSGENMAIKEFAKQQGVEFVPSLLFFDENGKRVWRQVGYQAPKRFVHLMNYVADKHYEKQTLRDFLSERTVKQKTPDIYTALKDDKLFDTPPYALDRSRFAASQPLMVLFEKTGCAECEEFHKDVLADSEVREALKGIQIVRMDANDDKTTVILPDGKRTTPAQWYQQTDFSRLPALMFFNETGKLSLQTDAYVLKTRVMNSINYMLEKAYTKDLYYQHFARQKGIERNLKKAESENKKAAN